MISQMVYSKDWVTWRAPWWQECLGHLAGAPTHMLEIGFYEGRSAAWFLANVLSAPGSTLVAVDHWPQKGEMNRACLVSDPQHGPKLSFFPEDALAFLSRAVASYGGSMFDAVYIDAAKEAADLLAIACLAYQLVRPGGVMIFDDYTWGWTPASGCAKPDLPPRIGIDAFLSAHSPFLTEPIFAKGQVCVRKQLNRKTANS